MAPQDGFGRTGFPLGVEEELLVVDAATLRLSHTAVGLLRDAGEPDPELDGALKPDTYAAMVELISPVSSDAAGAVASLSRLRARLRDAGGTMLGAGIHPDGAFGDVEHFPGPRYAEILEDCRGLLRRTPTAAVHVHVGMPDRETALRVHNGLRTWLPLLQALSGNSPWWFGRDSGLASARAALFASYPRAGIPAAYADWDAYETATDLLCRAADIPDYTFLWQDIRMHPRLGTVEVRAMDAQGPHWAVTALADLVQGLAELTATTAPGDWVDGRVLSESSFRAARDGMGATIWHGDRLVPVPDVLREAVALTGRDEALRFLDEGGGADRQRAAVQRGGLDALLALLAAETA